jgi:predicted RNA-binding Zn ribbon-like protein
MERPTTARTERPAFSLDLANTVACPACRAEDALGSVEEVRRWMRRKLPGAERRWSPRELASLRRFRARLRELLDAMVDGTTPPHEALAALNSALHQPPVRTALAWERGHWVVNERTDPSGSAGASAMAAAARSVLELVSDRGPLKVRRCDGPGCVHFLLARRPQQRWCSASGCGNRTRVQRHYQRVRALRIRDGPRRSLGPSLARSSRSSPADRKV